MTIMDSHGTYKMYVNDLPTARVVTPADTGGVWDTQRSCQPGEAIVDVRSSIPPEPTEAQRAVLLHLLGKRLHLAELNDPRLDHLLRLYHMDPAVTFDINATGARMTFWWTHHKDGWKKRFGETRPWDLYDQWTVLGTDGYSNCEYHTLLWILLAYLRQPNALLWQMGFGLAVQHAASGLIWAGGKRGMFRYSKGHGVVGGAFAPSWAKTYFAGLASWALASNHPFLWNAVHQHVHCLRTTPPNWYEGSWGIRGFAHYLRSLQVAIDLTRDTTLMDKAADAIRCLGVLFPSRDEVWVQKQGHTSPWMQVKAVAAMADMERYHGIRPYHDLTAVATKLRDRCYNAATNLVAYRYIDASTVSYSESHPTTHPMLFWSGMRAAGLPMPEVRATALNRIGLSRQQSLAGNAPRDMSTFGYVDGNWGPGTMKAVPMILMASLL